jgi:hypothetical protein
VYDIEPLRGEVGVDERLERLREQVEELKSSAEARPARTGLARAPVSAAPRPTTTTEPRPLSVGPSPGPRPHSASSAGPGVGFWELLGPSPQDRVGFLLIGAGAVAVLYAILTQLRF